MTIEHIKEKYNPNEALGLVTQIVHEKIKYHETKISKSDNEEDIKDRESKIIKLQKQLYEMRKNIESQKGFAYIESYLSLLN